MCAERTHAVKNEKDGGNRPTEGSPTHIASHMALGAVVSALGGNDAVSGALAAGGAEALVPLFSQAMYGTTDPEKLTAEDKQNLSNMARLFGSAVGVATGNGTANGYANVAQGSLNAGNAVENNGLQEIDPNEFDEVVHDRTGYKAQEQLFVLQKSLETFGNVIELTEISKLKAVQSEIRTYLENKQGKDLSETELKFFAGLYAANETIFPTNAIEFIPLVKPITTAKPIAKYLVKIKQAANSIRNSAVANTGTRISRSGAAQQIARQSRQTGGRSAWDAYEAEEKIADAAYDTIRNRSDDVAKIAKNTGIKPENIQKVKDHVFYNEHLKDKYGGTEIGRFESDIDQANAWNRLIEGTHTQDDITWLKHEAAERWYERNSPKAKSGEVVGYKESHNKAERKWTGYPWKGK
ncbi:VENN motif pre-toxin domain-containing protein [Kingella negevensis]|uniref:VENN motif pre-toxin domain-containing protein n=1 Tax=Kingella negevensis TaxID=1522312 RepID=UPI00254E1281|nr:VENN motif pre-toxin domain-containing protein [Kingella negevensis]MDK4679178.1 VENN motif pre-toxin domain-containing protein [Kingella negevensis]MDK4683100.1 VENN motif pre-toxin domain-containing protein [Kingella negevensis]MDK4685565.1 VENN motif pre-toxin domain-containing protein [Kingella negevensis]MDK4691299.1 VENN motif pre-toxin domain-containing protein [Kingella negevensis]MDK4693552.1 VENN motif pre-toxin domain-containing protein [Kingella negevensis]